MNRRDFLRNGALAFAGAVALPRRAIAATKPNIVFLFIDDLGWADVGCYGSDFHDTPVIDSLAKQGMRFTDAYAAGPVCSPTRASVLTGKYPATVNLTDFIPGHYRPYAKLIVPKFNYQLPHEEISIGEAMKAAGYKTCYIGKWHLGWGKENAPDKHGFDVVPGGVKNQNDKRVAGFTDAAIDFMTKSKDEPFFLFLSHHTVHIPLEARQDVIDRYKAKLKPEHVQRNPGYAAMMAALDESVARILKSLDALKLAENSVVVFASDNGGLIKRFDEKGEVVTSNRPLRSEKGSLYEGGARVPLIIRWPGVVKAGSESSALTSSIDFYPTFVDMAGSKLDAKQKPDGVSIVPVLKGGTLERETLYWHYPHYHHTAPCGAIRVGNYKLIEYFEDGKLELYDLKNDIGEKVDLAPTQRATASMLQAKLAAWRKEVGAKMPAPNPNHDPARAHEWGKRKRK